LWQQKFSTHLLLLRRTLGRYCIDLLSFARDYPSVKEGSGFRFWLVVASIAVSFVSPQRPGTIQISNTYHGVLAFTAVDG
jgi:hypothetical protein